MLRSTHTPFWYWFSFLSGPITWAVHFGLIYALGEFGCISGFAEGVEWVKTGVIVATVIGLVILAGSSWLAYTHWQTSGISERQQFMAAVGLGLNLLFALVLIASAVPVFFLATCKGVTG